jgi:hypothetical protein
MNQRDIDTAKLKAALCLLFNAHNRCEIAELRIDVLRTDGTHCVITTSDALRYFEWDPDALSQEQIQTLINDFEMMEGTLASSLNAIKGFVPTAAVLH